MSHCPDCRRHKDEIDRLRRIIAEQDRRHLDGLQRRAAFLDEMTEQMARWTEAQNNLIGGRP